MDRLPKTHAAPLTIVLAVFTCAWQAGCDSGKEPILEDDSAAVIALKQAGANVEREANMGAPDMIGRKVDLSDTSMDAELLQHLSNVSGLMTLTFTGPKAGDQTLAAIPEIKSVTHLNLTGSAVTDEGLKHLASLPSLFTLNLTDTQVTGSGLADVPPKVSSLVLGNLPIRDDDLERIQHLKRLSMLILTGTHVTPEAVKEFRANRPGLMVVGIKLD